MTNDIYQVNWVDLKTQVRQHWNKLTEDDLSLLNDGTDILIGLLRKRYGFGKAQAEIEIDKWLQEVYPNIYKSIEH